MKALFTAIGAATLLLIAGCASSRNSGGPASAVAESKSRFAKFGTNKVHYEVEGKGKHTIVFVHCWSGNLGFWNEQVPALRDRARLILIDLPGHGQSDKPHTAYTMDFFAEAVLAVMRDARVDKATLVGHSMGVPVICRVYKQAPDRVAALIAVDGTLRKLKMTPEQADQFVARFRDPDYREKTRQAMGAMFPFPGTEVVRDRVVSELVETPQFVMVGAMEGMFGPNQPDWDPQHVSVPLILINAPNRMWNDEYKEYVRGLSAQVEYRSIDGVGHWLMLEKPAEFNATLVEMLGKYDLIDK
jgi:pimeloyl-ACP methyl ester carboxylesterase